nr:PIN domain nuclease [Chiayiivirga flava]
MRRAAGRRAAGRRVILVDSSVWVDFFRGNATPQTDRLNELLLTDLVAIGDLILTEVLQGFTSDEVFRTARRMLSHLDLVVIGGPDVMIQAASNFRTLRARGVTVRKTIDTLIATRCIVSDLELLHADRDFDAFATYLGLRVVHCG